MTVDTKMYANTYWSHRGKHPILQEKMAALIPASGSVENADDNPALEKFRIASNCYYDLYNNGLCNRAEQFQDVFGIVLPLDEDTRELPNDFKLTKDLVNRTEKAMDKIILAAVKEQGL